MEQFLKLKEEILSRAKLANACMYEYERAYKSENAEDLLKVVKDNFSFCFDRKILTSDLISEYENIFNANRIYANVDVTDGYLLAWGNSTVRAGGNSTVEAWGNSTVEAWDNSTVRAGGNSTVEAWDNSTVRAWDNSTVKAWGDSTVRAGDNSTVRAGGNSTVEAWDNSTVKAWDNSTVRAWGNSTVEAWDNSTVEAWGNPTVEAWGNSYIYSYRVLGVTLNDNAIYRVRESNTIYHNSKNIKYERKETKTD